MAHILIVDDDEMNREVLARRLQRQGHTTESAEDGFEALKILHAMRFDLVLLDVMMPKLYGFQVLARIKADATLQHISVIMLSAANELDNIYKAIELGAEDYLLKPFNAVLLKSRIDYSLAKQRLLDPATPIEPDTPLAEAVQIVIQNLQEPIEHSMRCIDQLITRAAGPI